MTQPVERSTLSCWLAQVTELPPPVHKEAREIRPLGVLLYPYWLVDVRVHIGRLLLPRVSKQWQAAVDGVTGIPSVLQPGLKVVDCRLDGATPGIAGRPLGVAPFVLRVEEIDRDRLQRTLWPYVSRRLRSWVNVDVEIGSARAVYKELRLFRAAFRNGSSALLALDTLTGEYGVAPSVASAVLSTPMGPSDRQGEDGV
jgi:hypothetical protein